MKVNKNWLINNAIPVFFIGFFISLADSLIGRYIYVGWVIMLISFNLMYLSKKKK